MKTTDIIEGKRYRMRSGQIVVVRTVYGRGRNRNVEFHHDHDPEGRRGVMTNHIRRFALMAQEMVAEAAPGAP